MGTQLVLQLFYFISQYFKELNPLICFGTAIFKDKITLKLENYI